MCQKLFFIKYNFKHKCKIFKNLIFTEQLWAIASEECYFNFPGETQLSKK